MNKAFAVPACLLCVSASVCMHLYNLINVCVSSCVKEGGQQMISSEHGAKDVQPQYKYPRERG